MKRLEIGLSAGIDSPPIRFYYKNWRGESGYRTIKGSPVFWYGESEYYKGSRWFIKAFDVDKQDIRDFAVDCIIEFVKEI